MGMVGARELLPGEAPALHSAVERLVRAGERHAPAAVSPSATATRGRSRPGAGRRAAQRSPSRPASSGVATPAELEGIVAHELAHLRYRDVLVQTVAAIIAAAVVEASRLGGWLERGAPVRARTARGLVRPPPALAEARVRRRPLRRGALRFASRPGRRACSGSRARWSSSRSRRARQPSRCTPRTRSRMKGSQRCFVTHPAARRAGATSARARSRVAREAARRLTTRA